MTTAEMQAQVVRYNVVKLSVVRNAVPLVVLVTIGGKYIGIYALGAALLLQLAIVGLFVRARNNLGRQTLKVKRDSLTITSATESVLRQTTTGWALSECTARVYGPKYSYRFRVAPAESNQLKDILTQALGPKIETKHRGSARARAAALAVATAGVAALGGGIALELLPLGMLGLIALLLGSATYGVLSQRISVGAGPSEH